MLYHIVLVHIISYYIISNYIILFYIILYYIILYYNILYHTIVYHIISYHIISYYIIYIMLYYIISYTNSWDETLKLSEFRGQQSQIPTVSNHLVIASDQGIHPSSRPIPCRPIRRRGSFFCLALMLLQQRHFLCQVDDVDRPTKKTKNSQLVYSFDPKLKMLMIWLLQRCFNWVFWNLPLLHFKGSWLFLSLVLVVKMSRYQVKRGIDKAPMGEVKLGISDHDQSLVEDARKFVSCNFFW